MKSREKFKIWILVKNALIMKFSVIIPVYDAGETLRGCLDSVLGQEYGDFELILVDDGSTDDSGRICDEYAVADKRVMVIHKRNGGASTARNVGIEAATGEYLVFIDSDDYVDADYLSRFSGIEADCGVCGFRRRLNGQYGADLPADASYAGKEEITEFLESCFHHLYVRTPWSKVVRRRTVMDKGIRFDEKIRLGEDSLFVLECYNSCDSLQTFHDAGYVYTSEWTGSKYLISARDYRYFIDRLSAVLESYGERDGMKRAFAILNRFFSEVFTSSLLNMPFGRAVIESIQFLRLGLIGYVPRETWGKRLWSGIGVMTLPYQQFLRRRRRNLR